MDLTKEAAEGYLAKNKLAADCPHYVTSPAGMAWLVGRYMANNGYQAPTPGAKPRTEGRHALTSGRGMTISLRGYADVLLARFRVDITNVTEIR